MPIDTLKIDRSFVRGIGDDAGDREVVRAVTALAHSLGMDVTAEGIETAEQLAQLRAIGSDRGQGYHLAKPLPGEEIEILLRRNSPTPGASVPPDA